MQNTFKFMSTVLMPSLNFTLTYHTASWKSPFYVLNLKVKKLKTVFLIALHTHPYSIPGLKMHFSCIFFFPFHLMDPLYTLCLSLPLSLPRQGTQPPVILFSTSFPTSNTHLVLEVSSTSWNKGFPCRSVGKESAYSAGDLGSIPGSGRSPGEGNGNSLQYSCLENPMDRGAW